MLMRSLIWLIPLLVLAAAVAQVGLPSESPAGTAAPPADEALSDLVVTLAHTNGTVDKYQDEIARMDLILDQSGRLDQVHLITRTGPEPDTHIWYNMDNLVSVRYQFLAITGKGKVSIRTIAAPPTKASPDAQKRALEALDPEDYR